MNDPHAQSLLAFSISAPIKAQKFQHASAPCTPTPPAKTHIGCMTDGGDEEQDVHRKPLATSSIAHNIKKKSKGTSTAQSQRENRHRIRQFAKKVHVIKEGKAKKLLIQFQRN